MVEVQEDQIMAIGWNYLTEQASVVGPFKDEEEAQNWIDDSGYLISSLEWRIRQLCEPVNYRVIRDN